MHRGQRLNVNRKGGKITEWTRKDKCPRTTDHGRIDYYKEPFSQNKKIKKNYSKFILPVLPVLLFNSINMFC